nr:YsnF/AvaK domain-containing protein [Bacillus sp. J33]
MNNQTAASTSPIEDDKTIRIPITEERVEVSKKPVVTDEVVVGKQKVQETQQVTENLKKEEVHLEGGREYVSDDEDFDRPVNRRDNDKP